MTAVQKGVLELVVSQLVGAAGYVDVPMRYLLAAMPTYDTVQ